MSDMLERRREIDVPEIAAVLEGIVADGPQRIADAHLHKAAAPPEGLGTDNLTCVANGHTGQAVAVAKRTVIYSLDGRRDFNRRQTPAIEECIAADAFYPVANAYRLQGTAIVEGITADSHDSERTVAKFHHIRNNDISGIEGGTVIGLVAMSDFDRKVADGGDIVVELSHLKIIGRKGKKGKEAGQEEQERGRVTVLHRLGFEGFAIN